MVGSAVLFEYVTWDCGRLVVTHKYVDFLYVPGGSSRLNARKAPTRQLSPNDAW